MYIYIFFYLVQASVQEYAHFFHKIFIFIFISFQKKVDFIFLVFKCNLTNSQ